jgi:hypothetical protein
MVQSFFHSRGVESAGLNDRNLGGAAVGESQIYFEYQPLEQSLKCSALVYRFQAEPRPGVIEAFKLEEQSRSADTGGGTVDYEPENKGLYLSREYSETMSDATFAESLEDLMKASRVYGDEVLDRVASKVFDVR